MANHNIKFLIFNGNIDPHWVTDQMLLYCDNLPFSGYEVTRHQIPRTAANSTNKFAINAERGKCVAIGQNILQETSDQFQVPTLRCGLKTGQINPGQIYMYILYGYNNENPSSEMLCTLKTRLRENLPFTIDEAYSNVQDDFIRGDIVAMNSSTLRGIIAHD